MCRYTNQTCQIKVVSKKGPCRYHAKGCHYDKNSVTPGGICSEIYHNAYPYCLSLIYGANFNEEILIRCPSTEACVVVRIYSKPIALFLMPGLILRTILNFFTPVEIVRKQAIVQIKAVQGHCANRHTSGQKYIFPMGSAFFTYSWSAGSYFLEKLGAKFTSSKFLCPAFFDSFYPLLGYFSKNHCFPWKNGPEEKLIQCTDHLADIKIGCEI